MKFETKKVILLVSESQIKKNMIMSKIHKNKIDKTAKKIRNK